MILAEHESRGDPEEHWIINLSLRVRLRAVREYCSNGNSYSGTHSCSEKGTLNRVLRANLVNALTIQVIVVYNGFA